MTVTVDSAVNSAWKYMKLYPDFVFGTGYDAFANRFNASWDVGKKHNLPFKKRFGRAFNAGKNAVIKHNDRLLAENNGSFWKATKKSITSIWPDLKDGWKTAGETAKAANKSKLWARLGSIGKVFGKRMPLIGAVITLAVELPNIIKTTYNEGLLAGAAETGKTGVRLGISTLCGALAQTLIPVPLLGGVLGFAIGDMIGRFVVGKSYSDKKAEEKQAAANTKGKNQFSFNPTQIPYGGITNNTNPFATTPQTGSGSGMSDQEFQKLQQMYMQYAGGNNMNYSFPNSATPYSSFNTMA